MQHALALPVLLLHAYRGVWSEQLSRLTRLPVLREVAV